MLQCVSMTLQNPKVVHNRKYLLNRAESNNVATQNSHEVQKLVGLIKSYSMLQILTFGEYYYSAFSIMPHMKVDLKRFCVDLKGIFTVDTTFQLADKLWLTDSTYPNMWLVDQNDKHPELPGPNQWQFRKDRESYKRFAGEMVLCNPDLQFLQKFGHDLDPSIAEGLNNVFYKRM